MGFFKDLFNRPPKPGKPQLTDDDTFELDVLASETPAVVDFWSSRCPPCHVMGGLLNEFGPEYVGRVNIFKLNVDQNPRITMRYRIHSVPTVIFFRNGRVTDTVVGLMPLIPLKEKFDRLCR